MNERYIVVKTIQDQFYYIRGGYKTDGKKSILYETYFLMNTTYIVTFYLPVCLPIFLLMLERTQPSVTR